MTMKPKAMSPVEKKKIPHDQKTGRAAARRFNPSFDSERRRQLLAMQRFRGGNLTSILSELVSTRYADLRKLYPDAKELELDAD